MRILQICPKPPYPPIDGGCLASLQLSKEIFATGWNLDVISITTPKHPFVAENFDPIYQQKTNFRQYFIDTSPHPLRLLANLIKRTSIWEDRFYDKGFSKFLKSAVQEGNYDIVILDGLMTANYLETLRKNCNAKIIYRSHNIEHALPEQRADMVANPLKKWYLKLQSRRLARFEIKVWIDTDCTMSISNWDSKRITEHLVERSRVITLPFSIEVSTNDFPARKNTVFHLGAMDWQPNIEGVSWFLKDVWPKVRREIPDASLHLGGKDIAGRLQTDEKKGVIIHDHVPDALTFIQQFEVMIVPIRSGSGTRIKVLEGMAAGKAIVSTEKGIEGIPCQHDNDVLLADDAENFANQIIRAMQDEELRTKLKIGAKALISQQFSPERNVERFKQIVDVLQQKETMAQ